MAHLQKWLGPDEISRLLWSLSDGALVVFSAVLEQRLGEPCGEGSIEFREVKH